jgi:hypothetical protein
MLREPAKRKLIGMTTTTLGSRIRRMLHAIADAYVKSAPFYLHSLAVGPVFTTTYRNSMP